MSQVQKIADQLTQEELFKLGAELAMGNFINAYLSAIGGDIDEVEDVEAAMSLWFKAASDVKAAQLARFEDDEVEGDDEGEDEEAEVEAA